MHLCPELHNIIFQYLTKSELKVTRLVCKSFHQAAIPFLFDEVFLAARYSDLEVADHVASRFGAYVKTIALSSVEYKPLSMKEFRERTEYFTKTFERINGHREHAFEVYCRAQRQNLEIYQSGEFMARLCLILNKAPNCRKMILTDCGSQDPYSLPTLFLSHEPLEGDDLCPFKVCSLSVSDHLMFQVRPTPPYQMTPNPFHLATLAISMTKSTITELVMIPHGIHGSEESFLIKNSFNVTAGLSCCSTILLQQLTRLRMRLFDDCGESKAQRSYMGSPIAKALSSAISLESLFIEGGFKFFDREESSVTMMSTFLEGCRFPKLRSLIMTYMNSAEDELLDFLKTSPCLKHLTMEFFSLVNGNWKVVAQRIRSALQLKSVMLDVLSGGFSDLSVSGEYYSNNNHLVERYFLHNGENPFTERAMDLWLQTHSDTRPDIKKALRREQRYEIFR